MHEMGDAFCYLYCFFAFRCYFPHPYALYKHAGNLVVAELTQDFSILTSAAVVLSLFFLPLVLS